MGPNYIQQFLTQRSSERVALNYSRLLMLIVAANTVAKMLQERLELSPILFWITAAVLLATVIKTTVFNDLGSRPFHWGIIAVVAITHLILEWPAPANHLYVYIYLSIILGIVHLNNEEDWSGIWVINTRILFVVIMALAVLQKLITPAYMDGSINSFWLVNGGYFQPMHDFLGSWNTTVDANHDQLNTYYNEHQTRVGQILLQSPVENLRSWGLGIAWAVILGEVLFPLLFLFHKSPIVKHSAMFLLVSSILITRLETGFLSLFCIIGIASCFNEDVWIQRAYLGLFIMMQAMFLFDYGYL